MVVPAPIWLTLPVPAIALPTVMALDRLNVKAALLVTAPVPKEPVVVALPICKVPVLMVVVPEYVLLVVKVVAPVPCLTSEPPPLITPDKVPAAAVLTVMLPVLPKAVVMLPEPDTAPVVDVSLVVLLLLVVLISAPRFTPTPGEALVLSPVKLMSPVEVKACVMFKPLVLAALLRPAKLMLPATDMAVPITTPCAALELPPMVRLPVAVTLAVEFWPFKLTPKGTQVPAQVLLTAVE